MTPQKLLEGAAANLEDAAKKLSSLANDLRAEHVDRHDVFGVRLEVVLVAADLPRDQRAPDGRRRPADG